MSDEWILRRAVPDDETCIVSMWLRALCFSSTAVDLGFPNARVRGSDDQIAWWALNHPMVSALVRSAEVTVLCDPDRATHEPGLPAVIWGWLVAAGDVVYGCGIKNTFCQAGMGRDVARALLTDRLERPHVQLVELVDLNRLKLVPASWTIDPQWWAAMRYLAQVAIDRNQVAAATATHILDPQRVHWLPESMRAA